MSFLLDNIRSTGSSWMFVALSKYVNIIDTEIRFKSAKNAGDVIVKMKFACIFRNIRAKKAVVNIYV